MVIDLGSRIFESLGIGDFGLFKYSGDCPSVDWAYRGDWTYRGAESNAGAAAAGLREPDSALELPLALRRLP